MNEGRKGMAMGISMLLAKFAIASKAGELGACG
jgi:hypothetical protein